MLTRIISAIESTQPTFNSRSTIVFKTGGGGGEEEDHRFSPKKAAAIKNERRLLEFPGNEWRF